MAVLDAGQAWTDDPEAFTRRQLGETPRQTSAFAAAAPARPAGLPAGDTAAADAARARPDANDIAEQWAGDVWLDVGRAIDPRLVQGGGWKPLAAALDRASRAGYDVQQHLPRLATREPLPEHHPARALHYRLIQECDAAITPRPHPATLAKQNAAAQTRLNEEARRQDDQRALRRADAAATLPADTEPRRPTPAAPKPTATHGRERGPRR